VPEEDEADEESSFPALEHFVFGENDAKADTRIVAPPKLPEKKTINFQTAPPPAILPSPKAYSAYSVPVEGLLTAYPDGKYWVIDVETDRAAALLQETLNEFSIQAEVTGIKKGPVITMFEILPAPGVKLSRIVSLQDNIALRLAASSVRIVAPIPGKHAVGIEVPNKKRAIVSFREIIETGDAQFKKMTIPAVLGKDITGEAQIIDLAKTPHMLIAGATGSGKSVCVNSLILSILYTRAPAEVKMILIDPKIVELKLYNDIPHLLTPVITEPKRAFQALQYCLCEMERRYALLDGMGVRDMRSYNERIVERRIAAEKLPSIVIIIDEFADLMATTGKELESTVARLAAMSRAVGIHLVLATQRPSIDVITGLIKANIPTRIAFMVASKTDSRIIIDQVGAEKLLGKGDMLYSSAADPFPMRIQGTFVSDIEVENVADYVKHLGEPEYIDDEIFLDEEEEDVDPNLFGDGPDPLYDKALEIVVQAGKASASYVQRRLKIGYNRAARLIEEMEQRGIVGPANGSKPRDIIHLP
jgi:S-DNA-T family DNA segregation ATPase FtsK/SpoIIIE